MGRQIRFVHTEIDTVRFLSVIEEYGGRIWIDEEAVFPTRIEEYVLKCMNSNLCRFLITSGDNDAALESQIKLDVTDGNVIEFSNSSKGCSASRTYEVGRLYISQGLLQRYDECTLLLYNQLCRYIRKNYHYNREWYLYYTDHFLSQYELRRVYAADNRRNITLRTRGRFETTEK